MTKSLALQTSHCFGLLSQGAAPGLGQETSMQAITSLELLLPQIIPGKAEKCVSYPRMQLLQLPWMEGVGQAGVSPYQGHLLKLLQYSNKVAYLQRLGFPDGTGCRELTEPQHTR